MKPQGEWKERRPNGSLSLEGRVQCLGIGGFFAAVAVVGLVSYDAWAYAFSWGILDAVFALVCAAASAAFLLRAGIG